MTKKRGTWILVVLALSVGAFLGALKVAHSGPVGHTLIEKGMAFGPPILEKGTAAIEAAKGSGIHWKNLFIFLGIAIPGVAILTRVIAWLCGRKKSSLVRVTKLLGDRRTAREIAAAEELEAKMDGIEWIEPKVGKPFATYQEYKDALTGGMDLDDFLARCRAGVPEDPAKKANELNELCRKIGESFGKEIGELKKKVILNPAPLPKIQRQQLLDVERDRLCHACDGRGQWTVDGKNLTACGSCNGTGWSYPTSAP